MPAKSTCSTDPESGLGRAYVDGYTVALANGVDYIVQMDADFSHDPNDIPRLLEAVQNADVAVGFRYVQGGVLDQESAGGGAF